MRHGERGDRRDQHSQFRHDQDQREHEKQVVIAKQDVIDAVVRGYAAATANEPRVATISTHGCEG
jgi:hypothetical protein